MLGPSLAVVGVGINFRLDDSTRQRIDQAVTDLIAAGAPRDRNRVLGQVLAQLAEVLLVFAAHGFAPLRKEWESYHVYAGARSRCVCPTAPGRRVPWPASATMARCCCRRHRAAPLPLRRGQPARARRRAASSRRFFDVESAMHVLAVDVGNTRIKWGLWDGRWVRQDSVPTAEMASARRQPGRHCRSRAG